MSVGSEMDGLFCRNSLIADVSGALGTSGEPEFFLRPLYMHDGWFLFIAYFLEGKGG